MIRILIVDDHPLVRQALSHVLKTRGDFEIVAEASDGAEAIRLATELSPDVVIMDISMPKINGIEATRRLKRKMPDIGIVVLTIHDDSEHVFSILEAGADAYLTKTVFGDEVIHAVYGVASGANILGSPSSKKLLKEALQNISKSVHLEGGEKLTQRDVEVLKLIANGMSNKAIANKLGLSLRTVKNYSVSIFAKLNVSSRTEAAIKALRTGIFTLDDIEQGDRDESIREGSVIRTM